MIIDLIRGDVFRASQKCVAFAVNSEGYNDAGFAGQVSSHYWPELANTGQKKLGDILSHTAGGKTFYALVCHSLSDEGWKKTPQLVEECLNKLDVPDDTPFAIVLMGAGMIGQMGGADVFGNLGGMARSQKRVVVYTL